MAKMKETYISLHSTPSELEKGTDVVMGPADFVEIDLDELRCLIKLGIDKAGSKRQLALILGLSGQTSTVNQYMSGRIRMKAFRFERLKKLLEEPEPSDELPPISCEGQRRDGSRSRSGTDSNQV